MTANTITAVQPLVEFQVAEDTLPDAIADELEQAFNGRYLTSPEIGHIAAKLLVAIPQWLDIDYLPLAQMIEDLSKLERGSGCYRAYAVHRNKQVVGFAFRPYWGGVWFPSRFETKLCEFEI
jgi:hypothetical protein